MDAARRIERMLYTCPEVNCDDHDSFPLLDENDYMGMCSEFSLHSSEICMFIFIRESSKHVPFVDIYIWDVTNLEGYDHFVICDGLRLPEELESRFLECTHKHIYTPRAMFHEANKKVIKLFPQWHYMDYGIKYLSLALQHMYFASHSSGAREILFKADGLEYIAANLYKLPSYNLMGTTPSDIIDNEMSLKLLRVLNRKPLFELLCDQSSRDLCKAAYEKYSGFIEKDIPSVGQWNYILELYKNGGFFGGYAFKKEIYEKASNFYHQDEVDAYKKYFSIRKELGIPGRIVVPDFEEIWGELDRMEEIIRYKKGVPRLDKLFMTRRNEDYRYEYSNNNYRIIMPSRAYDIYNEALYQHNCVADYIYDHANGETTILFLRKNDAPNVPFVTMEVGSDFDIKQLYGKFNKLPQKDVYQFIVEYSKAKVISYDMGDLIIDNIHKLDRDDKGRRDELIQFALSNPCPIKTHVEESVSTSDTEYHQISIDELITDCFFDDSFDDYF